ncbi:hypothetical protein Tco_0391070 [Tanacetum coccineum]
MTSFPEISRRARDMYHNLNDDDIMKNIFNSGRYKDKVSMQIPEWTILEETKNTEHYRMYAEVFGLDVPLTQSQPTKSTQGTHMKPRTPRSPNPKMDTAESSAPKRSTVIRFCLPERRSTHLTPPAPVPTIDKADEMIFQDTLQVSLAEHKSREEQEARENMELVNKHLASEEIEKIMEGPENVIDDSLPPRNDEPNILGTRLEPRSDKESLEVDITNDEERMEKGKIVEESRSTPFPTPIRSPRIHSDLVSSDTKKLQELMYGRIIHHLVDTHIKEQVKKQVPEQVRDQVLAYVAEGLILERQNIRRDRTCMISKAILQERGNIQAEISLQIQNAIDNHIPSQVDAQYDLYVSEHILHMKFENLKVPQTTCRPSAVRPKDQDDPHDDAHLEGENRAKRQKTSEYEAYVSRESSSGQVNENEQGPIYLG